MGRYKNTGFAHGTTGNNQLSIVSEYRKMKISEIKNKKINDNYVTQTRKKKNKAKKKDLKKKLIQQLLEKGVKISKSKVRFITKNKKGKIVWLESGNEKSGLKHILLRHGADFQKAFGITQKGITKFLKNVITHGEIIDKIVTIRNGRERLAYTYKYKNKKYVLIAQGSNGYIVTARPTKEEH